MAEKRMCPNCGGQMFMAKIIRAGLVEFTTDPNEPSKVLKENKDKFDVEIVGCARCKEKVAEADLVIGAKCKECGRVVGPMDINEDGICNVCVAVKQRTELANASREDLIKMLLDAEKKANPVVAKMEKQIEKADSTVVTTDVDTTEEVQIESVEQDIEKDKKKATRKVTRKKKDDTTETEEDTEIATEGAPVEVEPVTEAVNDIANQQEAPFPDLGDIMNPPEETVIEPTPIAQGEQAIGADFKMFDEGEEPF
jgi:hypothetical protein